MICKIASLYTTYCKQYHTDKYQDHIESLAFEVLFTKDKGCTYKRNYDREAAHH